MGRFIEILTSLLLVYLPAILKLIYLRLIHGADDFKRYKSEFFGQIMNEFPDLYNAKTGKRKKELFNRLKDLKSVDEKLRKTNELRFLEIGVGFGANLEYYPEKCHLIVVDPKNTFEQYFRKCLEKFPGITLEEWVMAFGENMKKIPSGSIDVVVTTLVTCSVKNIDQFYSEIQRVLAPGGKYIYMEHIIYEEEGHFIKYVLQKFLNLTRIWSSFFDGCGFQSRERMSTKLHRYLTLEHQDKFYIDTSGLWVFELISPHIAGVAIKSK